MKGSIPDFHLMTKDLLTWLYAKPLAVDKLLKSYPSFIIGLLMLERLAWCGFSTDSQKNYINAIYFWSLVELSQAEGFYSRDSPKPISASHILGLP